MTLEIPCHRCSRSVDISDLPHGGPAYCEKCVEEHQVNEEHWAKPRVQHHEKAGCPTCNAIRRRLEVNSC